MKSYSNRMILLIHFSRMIAAGCVELSKVDILFKKMLIDWNASPLEASYLNMFENTNIWVEADRILNQNRFSVGLYVVYSKNVVTLNVWFP